MTEKFKINETSLLVVEGKDEINFFEALVKHIDIEKLQIVDVGGKDKFQNELEAWSTAENFSKITRFAFICDAEKNCAESTFQSMCGVLDSLNIPKPKSIGTVDNYDKKKVGIYIMPDNIKEGMLENLCLRTLENTDIKKCIDDYIYCAKKLTKNEKYQLNESKSRVQVYLASKVPIVNSLGIAAKKKYWDFDHDCFQEIKEFLKNVFG